MNKKPLVSIVLPTFNGARYLAESIESCLNQTFTDWELIIVDDASTDATPGIIARFCSLDKRISAIRHDTNLKLPAALNSGFSHATGDFLSWTSDDNRYRPEAIEAMLQVFENGCETDIVYADYSVIDSSGTVIDQVTAPDPVYLMRENVVGPVFLYRRSVHEGIGGYDTSLFLVEDYDFWLRAAASFRMCSIHRDLYLYRRHESSLSSLHFPRMIENREATLKNNLSRLTWLPQAAMVAGWVNIAVMSRRRGDYGSCVSALLRAMRISPRECTMLVVHILLNGPSVINRIIFNVDLTKCSVC
ncbi:putative glycosyltransferase EpsE [Geobacter sp. OR-1]|uniref:glycosyltransferase family 2 protein n=1 Tax=Geobacter sp. OR-1 TaxID=1266765 RepID=UPI000541DF35|nr:glycosyltransferase [Geobacter sp. OR-1]GAM11536.1 putative glycosyltransferase EpsE [Geobacter sp. OR-1]